MANRDFKCHSEIPSSGLIKLFLFRLMALYYTGAYHVLSVLPTVQYESLR